MHAKILARMIRSILFIRRYYGEILKDDNKMTTQGIADTLGMPKRQIERIIAGLMRGGKLERVDSGKAGHWAQSVKIKKRNTGRK